MIRKTIIWLLLCLLVWLGGLNWFLRQIPIEQVEDDEHADAIVVLTGGAGRLEYGLQLLAAEQADRMFISGVGEKATLPELLRQAPLSNRTKLTAQAQNITLGRKAENTIGNAAETAQWLKANHLHSILLVTASYHMPRSVEEFEEVAPGLAIIPAPVFAGDFTREGWWRDAPSRRMLLSEYHKFIASKLRHWFVSATHRS